MPFQLPSHGYHSPSDCHADESLGWVSLGLGQVAAWPAGFTSFTVASPAFATSLLAPEPTPFNAPLHQHLLPHPSLQQPEGHNPGAPPHSGPSHFPILPPPNSPGPF